jgi:hypothetical protein
MPEYNILDKYERRPIHFAAACEGPEPLEYLLSKYDQKKKQDFRKKNFVFF